MKSKFWLTIASFLAPFTAQANIDIREHELWCVKIQDVMYNVEIVEIKGELVRVKYIDGLIGMTNKKDVKWLTKLSSDFI
ncbi:hypothetical protein FDJ19_gp115 [Vibrio phage Ceto]|uniref:Uncharacterized protein n=1 Tax=Vibrio phage Ceto TaxID=2570300 RepID=A0A2H5BGS2_9CAUD|nr:hypothetical protein FDJ19_gp115 [Vibrio phage Ceto]AUG85183.1 hypothetical protein CETO_201 [Vibrio phage Ceto]